MKSDDVIRLEAAVRSANPVPQSVDLVGSEESSAVMLLVREGRDPMASTHVPQQLQPAGAGWRRAWAFVAAFVVVLLGIGAATLLLRSSNGPVVEQPEGTVQMGPVTWTKADTGDASIPHVVALGSGFIGTRVRVGDGGTAIPEIVTSPDGTEWSPIASNPLAEDEQILWRDGGPPGAVGEVLDPDHAGIILTRDGSSFVRSDPRTAAGLPEGRLEYKDLAIGDPGIVVVYHQMGLDPVEGEFILFSDDGETWQVIPKPAETVFISELASTPFGILMTAEADSSDRPNPGMLTWILTHELAWEELPITDEFIAGMSTPVGWGGGIIVAGDTWDHGAEMGTARIWHSPDTLNWQELDAGPFEGLSPVTFVGAHSGLLALAGGMDGPTTVMFSTDAETWETWRASDVFGGEPRWGEAASSGDTIVAPSLGSEQHIELWVGTIEGVEVPEEWPPATVVAMPSETTTPSPSTTVAAASLADADLTTVAGNLWLLMPTQEDIDRIPDLRSHSRYWWDTASPWFVGVDEWWIAAQWGAGHMTMKDNVTPDAAFQFGVFETPEQAQAALDSIAAQRRFTDPSLAIATIDLPADLDGFGVVIDRMADQAYLESQEPESALLSMGGFDEVHIVAQRLDRVVAVSAVHGNEETGHDTVVELGSVVADRASRLSDLTANPPARPSREAQPLPWLIFSGAGPTFRDLGIPTSYEMDGWRAEPCSATTSRCIELSLDGIPIRGFGTSTTVLWDTFDPVLEIEAALEEWVTGIAIGRGDGLEIDTRHFRIGGAPAVRVFSISPVGDPDAMAAIDVYMLTGNPMTTFALYSWDEIGDGIDPEWVRAAVSVVDALLLEGQANA
ncbi:MAG: hypothetical protein ABFS21_06435 [Actinomycetota bacterium]